MYIFAFAARIVGVVDGGREEMKDAVCMGFQGNTTYSTSMVLYTSILCTPLVHLHREKNYNNASIFGR